MTWRLAGATGVVVGLVVTAAVAGAGVVIHADPAHAATGATSSAVTVTTAQNAITPAGSPFPDLSVTVSQTRDLVSQGIRVMWTGARKSERPGGTTGGSDFLQIAQCWGEDPEHPGHPDRRTCQYGGTVGAGATRDGYTDAAAVAAEDAKYTEISEDFFSPTYTGIPFVAYNEAGVMDEKAAPADRVVDNLTTSDGRVIRKRGADAVDLNTNPFFTAFTTNEVKWAASGADGTGSVPFEVQTAQQSSGLGCGTPIVQPDRTAVGTSCWLVIIPRGSGDSGSSQIDRSGLWWDAWEHSLAVKLDFKPLGVRCTIGAAETQLTGSELIAGAIASWQPALCAGPTGSPFVLGTGNEADALTRAAGTSPSPLAFTSRPLDVESIGGGPDPLAYAPVALAGLSISFSIDREPNPQTATDDEKSRAGLPLTTMRLTPRLVAKLLTASYIEALPSGANLEHIGYKSFREPGNNPRSLLQDPEFLAINDPEWQRQIIVGVSVADMLVPSGRSDLAVRLWQYVLADPAARAWLSGAPDEHGMIVNPWFSTSDTVNPSGTALALPADTFPKADPVEKPDTTVSDPANGTGPINLVTWRPFTNGFDDGAYRVLRADGLVLGGWDKLSVPPKFAKSVRELFGSQKVLGLTTTPASALYQTVSASLQNPAGQFVAPTEQSMAAAAAAMTRTTSQPAVLEFDPAGASAKAAPDAYPLTMPVYAAMNPQQTDAAARATYAGLIRYAVADGQTPGTDLGQLPSGYAPIPQSWRDQAVVAANAIATGSAVPTTTTTSNGAGGGVAGSSTIPTAQSLRRAAAAAPSAANGIDAPAGDPSATGQAAGALSAGTTADDPEIGPMTAAIPAGVLSGIAAAGAVPLLTRIRRRV